MRPVSKSVSGVATSDWIVPDVNITPFNIGFGCVVSGTSTYTVEHTFDDPGAASPTVFAHSSVAAKTANQDGNYAFPIRAFRVKTTAGTGTVTITAVQAGI